MSDVTTLTRHLRRLRRHDKDGGEAGGEWPRQEPDGDASDERGYRAEVLDIERKWLLMARIDPEHFRFFYDKYRRPLLSFIQHRVGDPDIAEDLVAETFFEAMKGLWKFRFQGVTFGAWLYRLARRRIARYYQRRERLGEEGFVDEQHDLAVSATGHVRLESEQDRRLLVFAIRQLDPMAQDIVILFYWEELTLAQIGVIVGLSQERTKARLHRARRKLASLLKAPDLWSRLSREGRRAVDTSWLDPGNLRLIDGRDQDDAGDEDERIET